MIPFRSPVPRFAAGGDLFVGEGALVAIRALAGTRVAVVHAPSVERDQAFMDQLGRAIAAPTLRFHRWQGGEPTVVGITALAAELRAQRPDVIVAVGGGSVIDAARVAWMLYEHPSMVLDGPGGPLAVPALRGVARFAAVPTTAGAGAEVSSAVVLTDGEKRKMILVSGEFLPDLVILDPRAASGVPVTLLFQSLGDVLAHVVEGHCSRVANPFVREMTRQVFPRIWRVVMSCDVTADQLTSEQRLELMQLALQGGWVQNHRPPGLGHAVAHALARIDVPHAIAAGLCLVPSLRVNLAHQVARDALQDLAATVGLTGADALVDGIATGVRRIIPASASIRSRLGTEGPVVVETALADVTARTNPVPIDGDMVQRVLEALP